jgi:hypothetical protein
MKYLDFDLTIEKTKAGYRAMVLNSPAGQASTAFANPFSKQELEILFLRLGRPRTPARRIDPEDVAAAKGFGQRLFNAAFAGQVRTCLMSSLEDARSQNHGLRIRLRMNDAPELSGLPWEYLFYPELRRFFSLSAETPIVRYIELPERVKPHRIKSPLRLLVMVSNPNTQADLDAEEEWSKLTDALAPLVSIGLVSITRLKQPSLLALAQTLRLNTFHVLHFIGHGGFDRGSDEGQLLLEDDKGRGVAVGGSKLGTILHDHRPLRLVVLNACEGARSGTLDPFSGVAQSLVQQGIPAVIAMQFEFTDEAAITLAQEFYLAVSEGFAIDRSLAEARRAIFAGGNNVEWGTPVLYMRSQDGQLFDIEELDNKKRDEARRLLDEEGRHRGRSEVRLDATGHGHQAQPTEASRQQLQGQQCGRDEEASDPAVNAPQERAAEAERQEAVRLAEQKRQQELEAARERKAEADRQEAVRLAAQKRQQELEAERQRKAEADRQEAVRLAEQKRQQELEAERERKAAAERQEAVRLAEQKRQQELEAERERKAEAERQEAARLAERKRQHELEAERKRKAEAERHEARQLAERERKAEAERQEAERQLAEQKRQVALEASQERVAGPERTEATIVEADGEKERQHALKARQPPLGDLTRKKNESRVVAALAEETGSGSNAATEGRQGRRRTVALVGTILLGATLLWLFASIPGTSTHHDDDDERPTPTAQVVTPPAESSGAAGSTGTSANVPIADPTSESAIEALYERAQAGEKDAEQSLRTFATANPPVPEAQFRLGQLLYIPSPKTGLTADPGAAMALWQQASAAGHGRSTFGLANLYGAKRGFEANAAALEKYELAYQQGWTTSVSKTRLARALLNQPLPSEADCARIRSLIEEAASDASAQGKEANEEASSLLRSPQLAAACRRDTGNLNASSEGRPTGNR